MRRVDYKTERGVEISEEIVFETERQASVQCGKTVGGEIVEKGRRARRRVDVAQFGEHAIEVYGRDRVP